jgi:hypothetical protein
MRTSKHPDALSNTSLKRIIANKYTPIKLTKEQPDMSKIYDIRQDGWRKKRKIC